MKNLSLRKRLAIKKVLLSIVAVFCIYYVFMLLNSNKEYLTSINLNNEIPLKISNFSINIKEQDYDFLFSDIPTSLRTYQKGKAVIDNIPDEYGVSLRIRGNHAWHWYKDKPSFRLRVHGEKQIYGHKELDFINPEDASGLSNLIASIFASKIGLPHFYMTLGEVKLNGKYKGLYQITEPIASENLRSDNKLNGYIIEGNNWDKQIWSNEKLWEIENTVDENNKINIEESLSGLLHNLQRPIKAENTTRLRNCINIENFAKWSAFMSAIGSVHTDDFHNNFFVYDVNNRLFSPIAADASGFGLLTSISNRIASSGVEIPLYEYLTPIQDLLFRNPKFTYLRNKYLYEYITDKFTAELLTNLTEKLRKLVEPVYSKEAETAGAVITVPKLAFPIRLPVNSCYRIKDIERINEFYLKRCKFLLNELNKCEVEVYKYKDEKTEKEESIFSYVFKIKGNAPAVISVDNPITCFMDLNMNKHIDRGEISNNIVLYPSLKESKYQSDDGTEWLMLKSRYAKYILQPEWQTYLLGFNKPLNKENLNSMLPKCTNLITNKNVELKFYDEYLDENDLYESKQTIHIWSKNVE